MNKTTIEKLDDLFVKLIDRQLTFGDFEPLCQTIEAIVKENETIALAMRTRKIVEMLEEEFRLLRQQRSTQEACITSKYIRVLNKKYLEGEGSK